MKVLIACEESQTVCKAFRERGHEAYSNDIQECSGGHPEWHLQMDSLEAIKLMDWDLMIAHPPCTLLTTTGNRWLFHPEDKGKEKQRPHPRFPNRKTETELAVNFFMKLVRAEIPKIAIENPRGIMSSRYRKPDQYIHPYQFGDPYAKLSGLWLSGLPKLVPTNIVEPKKAPKGRDNALWYETLLLPDEDRKRIRSKTFEGIARAMAAQWG